MGTWGSNPPSCNIDWYLGEAMLNCPSLVDSIQLMEGYVVV